MKYEKREIIIVGVLVALAFILRFNDIAEVKFFTGDEVGNVATAYNFVERGDQSPDNWYHPPMKNFMLYPVLKMFGDNPYGWRIRNVVAGTLLVLVIYYMGEIFFKSRFTGGMAAILVLSDPLLIATSRTTTEEVPIVLVIALATIAAQRFKETSCAGCCLVSGLLFGIAVATKLYAVPVILVVTAVISFSLARDKRWPDIVRLACTLSFLPLSIYILSYAPWFIRGYTFTEWLLMQRDMLREVSALSLENFISPVGPLVAGGPQFWFIKPISMGFGSVTQETLQLRVLMNNLPVWLLISPSVVYLGIKSIRNRNFSMMLVPAIFLSIYGLSLGVNRPIMLHSSIPILPFGFLAVGFATEQIAGRWKHLVMVAALSCSLYLYPLAAGIQVPTWLYRPVLGYLTIVNIH